MHHSTSHLAILTLLTAHTAFSRPLSPLLPKISLQQSIPVQPASPVSQLRRLYARFDAEVPSDLLFATNHTYTVATPGPYDARYLCPVTIGGSTFNLDFDTGSSDSWVFSTGITDGSGNGHTLYDPKASGSAKLSAGSTWEIHYADGSYAKGNVYTDSMTIDNVTVTSQAIEAATSVSSQFTSDTELDGILGLAFSSLNSVKPVAQSTFLDNAANQGVISERLFTVDLRKGAPGSINFGYIDASKYTGQLSYIPVDNSSGFWNVSGSGYQVASNSISTAPFSAILDTGTSLMVMDVELVEDYWSAVNGAGYDASQAGYVFPCDAALPDLQLALGSYTANLPGSFMNFAAINSSSCYGGLQANTNIGISILGDIFLKSQFVVFDAGNLQAGFAAKDLNSTSSSAKTSLSPVSSVPAGSTLFTASPQSASTTYDNGLWHTASSSATYDDGMWHGTSISSTSAESTIAPVFGIPQVTSVKGSVTTAAQDVGSQPAGTNGGSGVIAAPSSVTSTSETSTNPGDLTITVTTGYTHTPATITLPTITYAANTSTNSGELTITVTTDYTATPATITLPTITYGGGGSTTNAALRTTNADDVNPTGSTPTASMGSLVTPSNPDNATAEASTTLAANVTPSAADSPSNTTVANLSSTTLSLTVTAAANATLYQTSTSSMSTTAFVALANSTMLMPTGISSATGDASALASPTATSLVPTINPAYPTLSSLSIPSTKPGSPTPVPSIPTPDALHPYNLIPIYSNSTTEDGQVKVVRPSLRTRARKQ